MREADLQVQREKRKQQKQGARAWGKSARVETCGECAYYQGIEGRTVPQGLCSARAGALRLASERGCRSTWKEPDLDLPSDLF